MGNQREENIYSFNELKSYIVGSYSISEYFSFAIYSHQAPSKKDKIIIDDKTYEVESVTDETTDDEREQGLSYSRVCLSQMLGTKNGCNKCTDRRGQNIGNMYVCDCGRIVD